MNIILRQPFSVSENKTGVKNADIIHPNHNSVNKKNRLFITCGGNSNQSLLAAQVVCEAIKIYFDSFLDNEKDISIDFIEKAIRMGEIALSEFKLTNPEFLNSSTTLSLCYIAMDCIYLCQLGESLVYQIRNNKIIAKFIDNSDKKIQSADKPIKINLITLKDIQADDQFFICNGHLSDVDDKNMICNILSDYSNTEEKLSQIKKYYLSKDKKHFSGHLIPIYKVFETQSFKQRINSLVYSFI